MFVGDIFIRNIFAEESETPFAMDFFTSKDRETRIEKHVEFLYSCLENNCCYKMTELMNQDQQRQ
jgi:hypothetical protein